MNSTPRATRSLSLIGAASLAIVLAASGCSWFAKSDYAASKETHPLEVPPDLDMPDTSAATSMPAVGSGSVPAASTSDGRLSVSAAEAYPKIGEIIATIPNVTVNGRAEALSSYDVAYKGESFLLRVLDSTGGSRLVALSADGRMLNNGPAAELMAMIKAKF